jgi:hypothetical protein
MATTALQHGARGETQAEEPFKIERDRGPWLFLAAPVSFALTVITLAWISLDSFR